jgi:hypothetical protein
MTANDWIVSATWPGVNQRCRLCGTDTRPVDIERVNIFDGHEDYAKKILDGLALEVSTKSTILHPVLRRRLLGSPAAVQTPRGPANSFIANVPLFFVDPNERRRGDKRVLYAAAANFNSADTPFLTLGNHHKCFQNACVVNKHFFC